MSILSQLAAVASTAIVSGAVGFGAATWIDARQATTQPIIDPARLEARAPAPLPATSTVATAPLAQIVSLTNAATPAMVTTPQCSPWEVSDVAMEEVLQEMINRGWRPPNQGDAIAAAGIPGIAATYPDAPMPYGHASSPPDPSSDVILDAPGADPLPATPAPVPVSSQPAATGQPAPAAQHHAG